MNKGITESRKQSQNGAVPDIVHLKKLEKGKQGITGLAQVDGVVVVYKISQYMNYLTHHEYTVLEGLNQLLPCCPHFCKVYSNNELPIHPNFREENQDPFEHSERPVMLNVLFMEYIPQSISLLHLIEQPTVSMNQIISIMKQTLLAVVLSQRKKQFVHYDLHSMNILVRGTSLTAVSLYIVDEDNVFCVPTYGHSPVIIDHGFSSSADMNGHPSYISLAYTDAGYLSPAFDPVADAKILLISMADDLKQERPDDPLTRVFRNIVKNVFRSLSIDWNSGWDKTDEMPIIDQLFEYIENVNEPCKLFEKYPHFCMDILQSLIILPLQPRLEGTLRELRKSYRVLVQEFVKIETELANLFYSLYIFRKIIDIARDLYELYSNPSTAAEAVTQFRRRVITEVAKVAQFCTLKSVDFEKLLCALYVFREQLEFQLFHRLRALMKSKFKAYSEMHVQRLEHMYMLFDVNFPEPYHFSENCEVTVYNSLTNEQTHYTVSLEDAEKLNELPSFRWGSYLKTKLL